MAGIYVHIPFCKSKCIYCDFYSIVNVTSQSKLVEALIKELYLSKDYLKADIVNTIYLGGGTPSMLLDDEIKSIKEAIESLFVVSDNAEITIEANPDDLTPERLLFYRNLGFNRLSLGVQSFNDDDLKFLNRRHNANQAQKAVFWAKEAGFNEISIDLIYGLPDQTLEAWQKNLEIAFSLPVTHLSSYHLTYEEGTKLMQLKINGTVTEASDESSVAFFEMLQNRVEENGFNQYEISNFSVLGHESKHNSNYWSGEKYLGIGPSAHSFDGTTRQWNVADVRQYIKGIDTGKLMFEKELLSEGDRYNELIITAFRTSRGLEMDKKFAELPEHYRNYFQKEADQYLQNGILQSSKGRVFLTKKGFLFSDAVMRNLMWVNED